MKKILLIAALLCPHPAPAQPETPPEAELLGSPYLQNLSTTGVTVMYQTRGQAHTWVEYGTDTLRLLSGRQLAGGQEVVHDIEHKVRLDGLHAGHTYYYRVCTQPILASHAYSKRFGSVERTPFYRFRLPAEQTDTFTAVVLNDLHMQPRTIERLSRVAATIPHDLTIFNGDCLPEPHERKDALQMVHTLVQAFQCAEIPAVFLRGNHEIRDAYSSGMLSLFDTPTGQTYFACSYGDTRLVFLDCGEDKPDTTWVYYGLNDFDGFRQAQADFLREETVGRAFRKAKRRLLFHHIPLFFRGDNDEAGDISTPCRERWLPLLAKAKFDAAFNGHTHRFTWLPTAQLGNPFPVVIGGGPGPQEATLLVIRKAGKDLNVEVIDCEGTCLHTYTL